MKSRVEIKQIAKENMTRMRGIAIGLMLLPIAVGVVAGILALIPILGVVISIAIGLFTMLLTVAIVGGYSAIYRGDSVDIGGVVNSCQVNPLRKIGGLLWMGLFVWLWSMLFCIPGLIKAISYSMTPYILAEHPNVTAKDALKISMRMTNGHKADLFVAELSFFGWMMLSSLTLHILGIVFVFPYLLTTMAGYFNELRSEALANGVITAEELGMKGPYDN